MRTLKFAVAAFALAGASGFIGAAHAQAAHSDQHHAAAPAAKSNNAEMSEGEIRKIDKANKKITLKHGPLKNLDMPAMTMAFEVTDPAMRNAPPTVDFSKPAAATP